jgi:hypothetical protein
LTKKSCDLLSSLVNSNKHFKKKPLIPSFCTFLKSRRAGNNCAFILCGQPSPNRHHKKPLMSTAYKHGYKDVQQMLMNWILQHITRIIRQDQVRLIHGMQICVINDISRMRKKTHAHLSSDGNTVDKIQHTFMILKQCKK